MITQKHFWRTSAFLSFLFLAGCSSPEESSTNQEKDPTIQEWNWKDYPQSLELPLQEIKGTLQAQERYIFVMPNSGTISWEPVIHQNKIIPKGTLLGIFDKINYELKKKEIPLLEELFALQKEQLRTIKIPQKKIALLKELQALSKEKNLARRIEENPEMIKTITDLFPNLEATSKEGKLIINDLEKALQKEFTYLNQLEESADWKEIELKEIDLQLKRMELEELSKASLLEMPFTGNFSKNINFTENENEQVAAKGEVLGIAQNDEKIVIKISMTDSPWLGIPAEELRVKLEARGLRTSITANFVKSQIAIVNKKEELEYLFAVDPKDKEKSLPFLNSQLKGTLVHSLEQDAYIVPKIKLFIHFPAFRELGWEAALDKTFPRAKVLSEGVSDIAIIPAN